MPEPSSEPNNEQQHPAPNTRVWRSVQKNGINLGAIAVVLAAILALSYLLASDRIAHNQRQAQIQALAQVMPTHYFDEDILANAVMMPDPQLLNQKATDTIYVAKKANKVNGWIIPATSTQGYSGTIAMLVGVDIDGNITGVRVIQHQETPGLGDKIDYKKSAWIDGFLNAHLINRAWAVKKDGGDFDQFTGATITPRAVVNTVAEVLRYYQQQQTTLLTLATKK